MSAAVDRDEVEAAFRTYYLTGPVHEDWVAWSELFADDAVYSCHFWGTFVGPEEIRQFIEGTMSSAPQCYSALHWYVIDGARVVYRVLNRADNPEAGGPTLEFPSLQVITYAGNGRWSSEEDWWILSESKAWGVAYAEAAALHDAGHAARMTRLDWGPWVDWARPDAGETPHPSWVGRDDVVRVRSLRDLTVGTRNPR